MQHLIAKEIEAAEEGHVSYEIQWIIPNWRKVRSDASLVKNQKATFETGLQPSEQVIQTRWHVGLKNPHGDSNRARVYWRLNYIKGSGAGAMTKLQVKICIMLWKFEEKTHDKIHEGIGNLSLRETIEGSGYLDAPADFRDSVDDEYINAKGSVQYTLILTLKPPKKDSTMFKRIKLEQFSKRSHANLRENLATLLNDYSNGDLKIVTRDGVELRAYQCILKVQCPVFVGMLNSDLSDSKTWTVIVEDISGKTMKILLHYFYTGDLLDGWNDPDTIVEFTYAAGKYQVTQVLELLDDLFGRNDLSEVSNLDVQLLNLAGKLSLKNAEKRLLQQIIGKVNASKSGEELLQLFGYDGGEVSSRAEDLAGEPMGESKVLEILDYAVGSTTQQVDFSERGLVLLAFVQRNGMLKGLEQVLLKKIAEVTSKFTTTEELIEFFGGDEKRG